MRLLAVIVGVLLLATLAAGCGGGESDRHAMEVKFDRIDYEMGNMENLNSAYGPHLTKATNQYIALVRRYADLLGPDEARRRLRQKSDEVAPYCLPCSADLADEAKRY